jgi:hypothetical protein
MARRTAADRRAEADRMRQLSEEARVARENAEYPTKLMALLEEATQHSNYELEVRNGMFALRDRDSRDSTLSLTMSYTENSFNALESLEWDLKEKADERAESERLSALRRQAFLKLSEEEQQALGLTDRNNW